MAYIGRDIDKISNVEVLDNITFDCSSSYTLQKGGSNFTPSSANTLLVSIDGIVQAGNFTVSGSTINFGTAVSASSTCNFILHYGVGLITAPADGTVTTAKLADSSVSLAKLTATGTKDATTFLRGDNTFASAGGTNTPAFAAYKNSDVTLNDNVETKLTWDTELFDTHNAFSSDRFTCPSGGAGKYQFNVYARLTVASTSIAWVYLVFKKNGNYVHSGTVPYNDFTNNYIAAFTASQSNIITLAENDYVEAFIAADLTVASGILNTTANEFSGYKLIE